MEKNKPAAATPAVRKPFIYALAAAATLAFFYYAAARFGPFFTAQKPRPVDAAEYKLFTGQEKKIKVIIFSGDAGSDALKPQQEVIYESGEPMNRIKQVLLKMMEAKAAEGYIRVVPEGAQLREVYQDKYGILYLDLSREFSKNCRQGITTESLAVYSIVDTLFYNFPWVKGVRFLIDGAEKPDVAGNISLGEIFRPDMDLSTVKI